MTDPEMYPGTDYPHYRSQFATFEELTEAVDQTDEGLNHIVAWQMHTEEDVAEDLARYGIDDEEPSFLVTLFMPRKTQCCEFWTTAFDPDEVEKWIENYVRGRISRWYGFEA